MTPTAPTGEQYAPGWTIRREAGRTGWGARRVGRLLGRFFFLITLGRLTRRSGSVSPFVTRLVDRDESGDGDEAEAVDGEGEPAWDEEAGDGDGDEDGNAAELESTAHPATTTANATAASDDLTRTSQASGNRTAPIPPRRTHDAQQNDYTKYRSTLTCRDRTAPAVMEITAGGRGGDGWR